MAKNGIMAKNEWGNDFNFLPAKYNVYEKLGQFFFHTLLTNLFKQTCSVTSYKYLTKLISKV